MQSKDLTSGSIIINIVAFSLPYLLSYFMQILYGLADLFVIGQYCGVDSITAVSVGSQVMHFVTVMIVGLAMGTTVTLAKAVGAKDNERVATAIGNTITLFMIVSVILSIVLYLSVDSVVSVMATPVEAISQTRDYLAICFVGIPAIVAYNIIASVFRGLGDSKSPMYFIAIACVVNVALDYLLIGIFNIGAVGAALATTLSQLFSVVIALMAIRRSSSEVTLSFADLHPRRQVMGDMLKIGVPIFLQDGFIQVGFLVITVIANMRGLDDAAAVGIVEKIIGVLFLVPSAMLSTVSAIAAQNIGANKVQRAKLTLYYALAITIAFGCVSAFAMQIYADESVAIFTSDPHVILLGGQYLKGYVWDCVFAGMHFCYSGFFCACGLSVISFIHNIASISIARIPLCYISSAMFPDTLFPMGLATVSGSVLSVIICIIAYIWIVRRGKIA
ncbi:MAG: MATE family efflux transporter [Prevotella sp.]|nr:MATE family efflux transporter [Prevotella sp.]